MVAWLVNGQWGLPVVAAASGRDPQLSPDEFSETRIWATVHQRVCNQIEVMFTILRMCLCR